MGGFPGFFSSPPKSVELWAPTYNWIRGSGLNLADLDLPQAENKKKHFPHKKGTGSMYREFLDDVFDKKFWVCFLREIFAG